MHNSGVGCAYTRAPLARAAASIYQTFPPVYFNRFTPLRDTQNTPKSLYFHRLYVVTHPECKLNIPDDGIDLPDDGIDLPDGGIDLPDDGIDLPDGGIYLPDDGIDLPDGGIDLPDDGINLPDDGMSSGNHFRRPGKLLERPGIISGVRENYLDVREPFPASGKIIWASGNRFRRPGGIKTQISVFLDPPDGVSRSGVPRLKYTGNMHFHLFDKKIPRAGTFFARIFECQHNKSRKRFLLAFHDDQESSHK